MQKFLIWCSGADSEILARCPTDRPKYIGLGGAILTTTALGFFSFMFAAGSVLKAVPVVAALAGLVWALAIFNLDRWLVSALKRRPTFWGNFWAFLPRLFLAIMLGTVITEPLVLRIFQPEIEQEVETMRQMDKAANEKALLSDPRFVDMPKMQIRIDELQSVVDGGVDSSAVLNDAEVKDLTARVDAKEKELATAESNVVCEIEGRDCGSGKIGIGPAAQEKQGIRNRVGGERDALRRQLEAKKAEVSSRLAGLNSAARSSAATELATLKQTYGALAKTRSDDRDAFDSRSSDSAGLLARMSALHRLGGKDGTLAAAQWMLRLFIIAIDAMPVLVKFLMSLFPPSLYERELERVETGIDQLQADEMADRREMSRLRAEVPLREAQVETERKLKVAERVAVRTIDAEEEVAGLVIDIWKEEQLEKVRADPDAYIVT